MRQITREEMRAFEAMIDGPKCPHEVPISCACADCEKEMMIDFIVHNLEDIVPAEVAIAVGEGIITVEELVDRTERRIRAG